MAELNACRCGDRMQVIKTERREAFTARILACKCGSLKHTIEVHFDRQNGIAFLPVGVTVPTYVEVPVAPAPTQPYTDTLSDDFDAKLKALGVE